MNDREKLKALCNKKIADAGLCAKWQKRKGEKANRIRGYMKLSPKAYRKILVGLTNVVETSMCANEWGNIDYNKVPSIASKIYQDAFERHDTVGYNAWADSLSDPNSGNKVNACAIFPHDVLNGHVEAVVEAQWKALPDFIEDGGSFLPMCDVSGSMDGLPMEVCVALGLYCAERNKSAFKDVVLTFTDNPKIHKLSGTSILERKWNLMRSDWGYSTNVDKAFDVILKLAVDNGVPLEDMPKSLIIFSDMQFDEAVEGGIAYDRFKAKYAAAGYELPQIVFWNLRASAGTPVKFDQHGTALVSGFSPSSLKNVLGGKSNPYDIMIDTLSNPRYDF